MKKHNIIFVILCYFNLCFAQSGGDLLITEIMIQPTESSSQLSGQYIEIFNRTTEDYTLSNVYIFITNVNNSDLSQEIYIPFDITFPANGFVVLGASSDITVNGGIEDVVEIGNLELTTERTIIQFGLTAPSFSFDFIEYLPSWSHEEGASLILDDSKYNSDNNNRRYWCSSENSFGSGDLGSPNTYNGSCNICYMLLGPRTILCNEDQGTYTVRQQFRKDGAVGNFDVEISAGSLSGDNINETLPFVFGNILIEDIPMGLPVHLTITDDIDSCFYERNYNSDVCDNETCDDVIITEIMLNPTQSTSVLDGQWFEIYNSSQEIVNMEGWIIENEAHQFHVISNFEINAESYAVFASNSSLLNNGGLESDYVYENIFLDTNQGRLSIYCPGGNVDNVEWNEIDFPITLGASMELDQSIISALNFELNDIGSNWVVSSQIYGDGDFGSPGLPNDSSLKLSNYNFENLEIYPNPLINNVIYIKGFDNQPLRFSLIDSSGKVLIISDAKDKIELPKLQNGIYFLEIKDKSQRKRVTKKIIIN